MSGKLGKRETYVRRLPKGLTKALSEKKAGLDSEALLNDLVDIWGGPRQLAVDIHQEFQGAPSGGMVRQRIMEMIQRLILTNTTHEIGRIAKPSDMTKEELESMAMRYVRRVTQGDTDGGSSTST
jgi:hypothetical protein